jgi:hypothetical protein
MRTKEQPLVKVTVHAYADDVIFVSENEDGITQMFEILDQFVEWSRIEANLSKCVTASDISDENRRWTCLDDSLEFRGEAMPNLRTAESMRYLDVQIAARRMVELKSAKFRPTELEF